MAELDITSARMSNIVQAVCPKCNGDAHRHTPTNYKVRGVLAVHIDRPDHAIALYTLTRGSAVVLIDGWNHRMWWFPTIDHGLDNYNHTLWPMFKQSIPPRTE